MQVFRGVLRHYRASAAPPKAPPKNSTAPTRRWRRCDSYLREPSNSLYAARSKANFVDSIHRFLLRKPFVNQLIYQPLAAEGRVI
jgi:hypothetical protein